MEKFSLCFPAINELFHVSLPPDRLQIPHGGSGAETAPGCGSVECWGAPPAPPGLGTLSTQPRQGRAEGSVGLQAAALRPRHTADIPMPSCQCCANKHAASLQEGLIAELLDHGVRVLLVAPQELWWCRLVWQPLPSLPCKAIVP